LPERFFSFALDLELEPPSLPTRHLAVSWPWHVLGHGRLGSRLALNLLHVQVKGSLPPASQGDSRCRSTPQRQEIFLVCRMSHVACGMPRMAPLGDLGVWVRSPGVLLHVRFVRGRTACTGRAHALSPLSGRSWATHRGSAISGHSARKPPRISAPHRHTLCACASGKNRGACVETGLCVPRPLRVPHVQKFWSACTDRSM
jgi:hypothetical protein